eukprot:2492345-Prymnesium_polylepis.1
MYTWGASAARQVGRPRVAWRLCSICAVLRMERDRAANKRTGAASLQTDACVERSEEAAHRPCVARCCGEESQQPQ